MLLYKQYFHERSSLALFPEKASRLQRGCLGLPASPGIAGSDLSRRGGALLPEIFGGRHGAVLHLFRRRMLARSGHGSAPGDARVLQPSVPFNVSTTKD